MDVTHVALINTAIERIEARSGGVKIVPNNRDGDKVLSETHVYSGGTSQDVLEEIPAIFSAPTAAVNDWEREMMGWLDAEAASEAIFTQPPQIVKLMMTETEGGAQRIATTRYGVRSKVGVVTKKTALSVRHQGKKPAHKLKSAKKTMKKKKLAKSIKR